MVIGKRTPRGGERHPRETGESQRETATDLFHSEITTTDDDVTIEERGGETAQRARCSIALQDAEHASEDVSDHVELVNQSPTERCVATLRFDKTHPRPLLRVASQPLNRCSR